MPQQTNSTSDLQFQLGSGQPITVMVVLGTTYLIIVMSLIWKLRLTSFNEKREKKRDGEEGVGSGSSSSIVATDSGSSDILTPDIGSSSNIIQDEGSGLSPDIQMFRHTLLLLALTVTMWTGWTLLLLTSQIIVTLGQFCPPD